MSAKTYLAAALLMPIVASAASLADHMSDSQMADDIVKRLFADGADRSRVYVSVKDGVAYLNGLVYSPGESASAAKVAASEPGIVRVVNNLVILAR